MLSNRVLASCISIALCGAACGHATNTVSNVNVPASGGDDMASQEAIEVRPEAASPTQWRLTHVRGVGSYWLPVPEDAEDRLTHEADANGFPLAITLDGQAVWLDLTSEAGSARLALVAGPVTLKLSGGELGNDTLLSTLASACERYGVALDLSTQNIDDDAARRIGTLSGVERLDLTRARLGDGALSHFAGLTRLHTLELWMSSVDDAGIAPLAALPALSELGLAHTSITDAAASQLGSMTALRHLRLSGTAITDGGLAALASLTGLESLSLNQTEITDASLVSLRSLSALQELSLPVGLSTETVAELRAALPDADISLQ